MERLVQRIGKFCSRHSLFFPLAVGLLLLTPGWVQAKTYIISGSYTGNATDNRAITGVGFQPDAVIVKADTNQIGVIRTSTMSGDLSKPMTGATVNRNGEFHAYFSM